MNEGVESRIPSLAPPDWSTIDREIHCPLCDYNLRGLVEPRCPECGHQFVWQEILYYDDTVHPFLFEHHPRRNIISFFQTLLASVLPIRFWKSVRPIQAPRRSRLILYCLILALPLYSSFAVLVGSAAFQRYQAVIDNRVALAKAVQRGQFWNSDIQDLWIRTRSVNAVVDRWMPKLTIWESIVDAYRFSPLMRTGIGQTILLGLCWPVLTFASLMIFQISMRRAAIKRDHVLRCIIYATDIPLIMLTLIVAVKWMATAEIIPRPYSAQLTPALIVIEVLVAIMPAYRLAIGYRKYLNFPHAVGVVISSQIIAFLAIFQLLLMINIY